jgi:pimeloyl-ACP methyl ester carboxylesterase
VLLGHSFGGYLAALYAVRHINMVEKLILISPVGISTSYVNITSTRIEDMLQYLFFKSEMTAPTFYKYLGIGGSFLFNKICTQEKFKGLKNKVSEYKNI